MSNQCHGRYCWLLRQRTRRCRGTLASSANIGPLSMWQHAKCSINYQRMPRLSYLSSSCSSIHENLPASALHFGNHFNSGTFYSHWEVSFTTKDARVRYFSIFILSLGTGNFEKIPQSPKQQPPHLSGFRARSRDAGGKIWSYE